jgi:hypothetical protein
MSTNAQTAVAARNLSLDAALDPLNSGFIDIYDGSQPATVATALSGQTKLARCALGNPAFAAASGGSKAANTIAAGIAIATGTPTWYTLLKSDGTTRWHENTVGASGSLVFVNGVTQIVAGATVTVDSLVISEP